MGMGTENKLEDMTFITYEDLDLYINKLDDAELLQMCREIYDWKYVSGVVVNDGRLAKFREKIGDVATAHLADKVVKETAVRFHDIIVMLLSEEPSEFLKFR